jgi:hypothetical protein
MFRVLAGSDYMIVDMFQIDSSIKLRQRQNAGDDQETAQVTAAMVVARCQRPAGQQATAECHGSMLTLRACDAIWLNDRVSTRGWASTVERAVVAPNVTCSEAFPGDE